MRTVNLTIDGIKVSVPEDYTIIKAAREAGIDVPALCYDPCLPLDGSCRICVVDVEGARSLVASCTTPVGEGMVVRTENDRVVNARKDILRLLLDNHPNDCLTCVKAGECKLQEYAYRYDVAFRVHDGAVRTADIDTSNPFIFRDDNKCILCGKCVRTCAQVRERSVLSFANRGFETRVSADCNNLMGDSSCVSCARCVEACPVGALMDARAMKAGRSWHFDKEAVKCKVCEFGCDFELLKKNGKVMGVRALKPIEGRPLCLKGRLSVDLAYTEDVQTPYIKKDGKFEESTWAEVLGLVHLMERVNKEDKKISENK